MKLFTSFRLALCGGIALLTNAAFAQPADYYPTQPAHPGAVFRTTVPKRNSVGRPDPPSATAPAQPSAAAATPATFSGSTYTVGPTISPTTTGPQAEEHVAVDPNNPNTLVAAISDFSSTRDPWGDGYTGYNTTKFAVSTDNGNSWQEGFVATTAPVDQGGYPITSDGLRWDANSDPVVAIDRSGRVYMSHLYFNDVNNDNGFYVNVDDNLNDGVQFTAAKTYPVAKNIHAATYTFEDKPWLAVDNSTSAHAGTVYVSWTHYFTVVTTSGNPKHPTTRYTTTDAIVFSRSTDHGATWLTTPIQVSPANQNGTVQGSQVAVGPDGTVYVVWESASRQFLSKSTDGGQTFSPAVAISPVFNDLSFNSSYRINSFPALAVNPVNGAVYVAYADQPSTSSRIEFIASYNQGASFTVPVALDDDNATGQRLMPGLAVDDGGTVHCSWFDTRNSPDGSADYFDIYATYSGNGGTTFAPNARVTTATVNAGGIGFIGDYSGIAAGGGYAHPVWTSANCQDAGCGPALQTASLILPGAERFLISATPAAQSVAPGANATFQVIIQGSPTFIAQNDSITFSVDGLPADGSFSFEPTSVTGSGSSTLTVNSSTLGSHPLTITATSSGGALAQSVPVRLDVQNPDFSLSLNPTSATVPWLFVANGTGTPSWTVNSAVGISRVGDFSDGVSLAVSGLPSGSSYSFDPNPVTGDASALTLISARVPGTYALTVTGTGSGVLSGVTRTASATLVVLAAPTKVSVVSPSGAIGYATSGGSSGTKDLRMTVALLDNFGQPVAGATVGNTLTLKNSNGTTSYSGTATTASNGTVTFTLRNAPAGDYSVLVTRVTATGLTWDGLTPPNGYTK